MLGAPLSNLEMIKIVAFRLGSLRKRVAFLGGSATGLLITDSAAPEVRPTRDVDIIVEIASRLEYYKLEEKLRNLGFVQSMERDDPVCRWKVEKIKVDVMPTNEDILGFSNRWYSGAIKYSKLIELDANLEIRLVTAPYFLATKLEAFSGRGRGDFLCSDDIAD